MSLAKAMHIPRAAENFSFFADVMTGLAGEAYEQTGRHLSIVSREPVGVALLIAPWNAPLVLSLMKLAAAIALGNRAIIKPSEYAPLSVLRMAELIEEAGVPKGEASGLRHRPSYWQRFGKASGCRCGWLYWRDRDGQADHG